MRRKKQRLGVYVAYMTQKMVHSFIGQKTSIRASLLTGGCRGVLPFRCASSVLFATAARRRERDDHHGVAMAAPPPCARRPDAELVARARRQIFLSARLADDKGRGSDLGFARVAFRGDRQGTQVRWAPSVLPALD